jgi:hypothetical protein
MLRHILHDWPNAQCLTILRHLRKSATPGLTKLLVVDPEVLHACPVQEGNELASIPGALPPQVPAPLLSNLGRAALDTHNFDFIVSTCIRRLHTHNLIGISDDDIVERAGEDSGHLCESGQRGWMETRICAEKCIAVLPRLRACLDHIARVFQFGAGAIVSTASIMLKHSLRQDRASS